MPSDDADATDAQAYVKLVSNCVAHAAYVQTSSCRHVMQQRSAPHVRPNVTGCK